MTNYFNQTTAVITGGASGIGKAVAENLLNLGSNIWILDNNISHDLIENWNRSQGKGKINFISLDISKENEVSNAFTKIANQGGCEIVINSAGIPGPNGINVTEVSQEDFEMTCKINLVGSFLVAKYALKTMLPNKYGRIVLIASIAGKEGNPGMAAYSASKAGVIGLAKSIGKEFAESGITINAVAPSTIMTPMVLEKTDPKQIKYMIDKIPMKRPGNLEEITNLITWIASPESSFITGFTFDMTGGRAVY